MKKIFPLFAVIIVLVLAVCSFHIIPTGYTGVKTSFGQIQETTIQSGKLNFCIPFVQSIHKVNNKQQDKHIGAGLGRSLRQDPGVCGRCDRDLSGAS